MSSQVWGNYGESSFKVLDSDSNVENILILEPVTGQMQSIKTRKFIRSSQNARKRHLDSGSFSWLTITNPFTLMAITMQQAYLYLMNPSVVVEDFSNLMKKSRSLPFRRFCINLTFITTSSSILI